MKNNIILTTAMFALSLNAAQASKHGDAVREFWAAVDMGNFDKAVTYLSAGIQVQMPFSPESYDLEAFRALGEGFRMGFPDIRHQVLETTEGKGAAAVRGIFLGTNTGSLMGNPPTGNRVELPFLQYWTFDSKGKAVRIEMAFDLAAFNAQLMKGIPAPPNKAAELANRFFSAPGTPNPAAVLDEILAPDFRSLHFPGPGGSGKMEYIQGILGFVAAFPDMRITVLKQHGDGNQVFTYGYWEGTHKGEIMGIPATGKRVRVNFMDIWTEKNGKLVLNEVVMDIAGLMAQLSPGPVARN
ncbi:MAG: ester cyclase [Saprospiraceae bacterium]